MVNPGKIYLIVHIAVYAIAAIIEVVKSRTYCNSEGEPEYIAYETSGVGRTPMGRRNGAYPRPHRRTAGTHGRSHVCRTVRTRSVSVAGTKGTRGSGTVDRFRMIRPMIVARAKVVIARVLRTIAVIVVAGTEIVVTGVIWTVVVSVVVTGTEIIVVTGVIWTVVVSVVVTGAEIIVVTGVIWTVIVPVVVTWTEAIVGPRGSLLVVVVTEPVTAPRAYVGVVVSSAPRSYCGVIPCLI